MILKCAQLVCLNSTTTLFPSHRSTSTVAANIFPQLQIFSSIFDGWNNIDIMKSSFLPPESFFNNSKYNRKIINISFWLSEILNLWKRRLGGSPSFVRSSGSKTIAFKTLTRHFSRSLSPAENPMFVHLRINSREAKSFKLNLLLYIASELFSSRVKINIAQLSTTALSRATQRQKQQQTWIKLARSPAWERVQVQIIILNQMQSKRQPLFLNYFRVYVERVEETAFLSKAMAPTAVQSGANFKQLQ